MMCQCPDSSVTQYTSIAVNGLIIHLCCVAQVIRKIGQYLKMNITVPDEYISGFVKANNTFLYQLVFDPINRRVVPLNPYPENLDIRTLSYAGVYPSTQRNEGQALFPPPC